MTEALVYKRIEQEIAQRIRSGVYPIGTLLPTELTLCKEFSTSRLTVAKGLSSLIAAGVIERIRGKGSFVRGNAIPDWAALAPPRGSASLFTFISGLSDTRCVPSNPALLEGMHAASQSCQYNVGVKFYGTVEEEIRILREFTQPINAGFVIWSALDDRIVDELRAMRNANFPFVLVDSGFPQFPTDCIANDNMAGSELLVDYLYGLGHRRISYLTVPLVRQSISARMVGMLSALSSREMFDPARIGIVPVTDKVNIEYYAAENHAFIAEWLRSQLQLSPMPTAILCSNDTLAASVLRGLRAMNIAVPEQISVAGMDNTETAMQAPVPLTTVAPNFYDFGVRAVKLLLERTQHGPADADAIWQCHLNPALVIRQSTAPVGDFGF